MSEKNFTCQFCRFPFVSNYSLKRHMERSHREKNIHVNMTKKRNVKCPLCNYVANFVRDLNSHFLDDHGIETVKEELFFSNKNDFFSWKEKIESETSSRYVKKCGKREMKDFAFEYYHCHRSGFHVTQSKNLRNPKKQGSSKLNGACPSKMTVFYMKDGTVKTEFYKTHVGHDVDPCHLSLLPSERKMLAEKIASNVPLNDILDEICTSHNSNSRLSLLTRQDLKNIIRTLNHQNGSQMFDVEKEEIVENCYEEIIEYEEIDLDAEKSKLNLKFKNILGELKNISSIKIVEDALDYVLNSIITINNNNYNDDEQPIHNKHDIHKYEAGDCENVCEEQLQIEVIPTSADVEQTEIIISPNVENL